ncbi:MAG: hypothetical protein KJ737_02120 [Proteobacteria bacterium]|nr:hypothetical protein [Pseudomonadota bacterium]
MGKTAVLIAIASLMMLSCGKQNLKDTMSISAILGDNGSLAMTFDIEFPDQESRAFFRENSDKIKYALTLTFKSYNSDELTNRGISNNTIKKLISSRFKINYSKITINEYDVRDSSNQKAKKKTVFSQ